MTPPIKSYRDLAAWQRARELGLAVYQASSLYPADERFGLISQTRRCSVSIASNIAEGYGRGSPADYTRFLRIARGSLFELETQMIFATDLKYLQPDHHLKLQEMIDKTARPLSGLIRSIERR